jgi:hypothetical protein
MESKLKTNYMDTTLYVYTQKGTRSRKSHFIVTPRKYFTRSKAHESPLLEYTGMRFACAFFTGREEMRNFWHSYTLQRFTVYILISYQDGIPQKYLTRTYTSTRYWLHRKILSGPVPFLFWFYCNLRQWGSQCVYGSSKNRSQLPYVLYN